MLRCTFRRTFSSRQTQILLPEGAAKRLLLPWAAGMRSSTTTLTQRSV